MIARSVYFPPFSRSSLFGSYKLHFISGKRKSVCALDTYRRPMPYIS